jgi:hypothetical protein
MRPVLIGASFGVAFAVVFAMIASGHTWYLSRPTPWNTRAVTANYGSLEFSMKPANVVITFIYDLENKTDSNYKIAERPDLVIMAKLADGDVLSKRFGDFQTADVVLDAPAFIPAKSKARMALSVSYKYPDDFGSTDRRDPNIVATCVENRLRELSGVVIFDPFTHYRIDLPSGWQNIAPKMRTEENPKHAI